MDYGSGQWRIKGDRGTGISITRPVVLAAGQRSVFSTDGTSLGTNVILPLDNNPGTLIKPVGVVGGRLVIGVQLGPSNADPSSAWSTDGTVGGTTKLQGDTAVNAPARLLRMDCWCFQPPMAPRWRPTAKRFSRSVPPTHSTACRKSTLTSCWRVHPSISSRYFGSVRAGRISRLPSPMRPRAGCAMPSCHPHRMPRRSTAASGHMISPRLMARCSLSVAIKHHR